MFQVVSSEVDIGDFAVFEFDGVYEIVFRVACYESYIVEFNIYDFGFFAV